MRFDTYSLISVMMPSAARRYVSLLALVLLFAAPVHAGTVKGIAAFEAGDYERAYEELRPEAEAGDAEAQYYLGSMYARGLHVETNFDQAREWMFKASARGHVRAISSLAYIYDEGLGISVDDEKAVELYRKAAEAGSAIAQRNLGLMYREGEGVKQSHEQAVKWFRKAAEQGDAVAWERLGIAYYQGDGVPQDYKQAFESFSKAAEEGQYWAQRRLAIMYDDGIGVEKNLKKAEYWYQKAIEHGKPSDKFLLGELYRQTEIGTERQALELYKAAAEQGHMFGQIHYGMFLMGYRGIDGMDFEGINWPLEIEGYAWALVAYERTGNPSARNAVEVFRKAGLTRDDIKRSEWRARKILEEYGDQWEGSE